MGYWAAFFWEALLGLEVWHKNCLYNSCWLPQFYLFPCCSWYWGYTGPRTNLRSTYSPPLSWFTLPVAPAPHCGLHAYYRCHRYTCPCLRYSPTRLLQLTLCWAPSWAVTVFWLSLRTWLSGRIPKFGHVSSYMLDVLHWLPLQQRISYRL